MATQRRATARHRRGSNDPTATLRFLRPPQSFEVQLGLIAWKHMVISVKVGSRGGPVWTFRTDVELDLEGRIPAEWHATLYKALEEFVAAEWTERISRTF